MRSQAAMRPAHAAEWRRRNQDWCGQPAEAVGDYLAGPSHTLPTGGTARFFSGLSAASFIKRTSLLKSSADWLKAEGPRIINLASAEGLEAHAVSVRRRLRS